VNGRPHFESLEKECLAGDDARARLAAFALSGGAANTESVSGIGMIKAVTTLRRVSPIVLASAFEGIR
jgi:hypothetical protein